MTGESTSVRNSAMEGLKVDTGAIFFILFLCFQTYVVVTWLLCGNPRHMKAAAKIVPQ